MGKISADGKKAAELVRVVTHFEKSKDRNVRGLGFMLRTVINAWTREMDREAKAPSLRRARKVVRK